MGFDLTECVAKVLAFRDRRDWRRFHTRKNLAVSISIEAAELLEIFQWETEDRPLDGPRRARAEEEAADVAIYLLLFCAGQEIDLAGAIERKITANETKYPADKARGRADKYDKL